MILAGDIGGTNTRLGLFELENGKPVETAEDTFPSGKYQHLEDIVAEFLAARKAQVSAGCFGIAGPVVDDRCDATNLAWVVDARQMEKSLAIKSISLINDLVANAYGTLLLEPKDLLVVNEGHPEAGGNQAIISPGTGLGEAGLFFDGASYHPFPSEGGHTDFAPTNALEIELYHYLAGEYGHVSYERILSGPGLYNLYRFLRDSGRHEEPDWLAREMSASDPSACIAKAAFSGRSPLCAEVLELFVRILGAEAGNLALKILALGGVWIGGGIMARWLLNGWEGIPDHLFGPEAFMESFVDKGRFRSMLEGIPVRVILNDRTALLGAAYHAFEIQSSENQ
ncbi:MAG: glucokinase [Planctomycetota bacterium]|jgi:glucokinase